MPFQTIMVLDFLWNRKGDVEGEYIFTSCIDYFYSACLSFLLLDRRVQDELSFYVK